MARKSKEFQQLFYEETQAQKRTKSSNTHSAIKKEELDAYQQFKENLINDEKNKDLVFIDKPKGIGKMSQVLEKFIEPYTDDDDDYEDRNFLLELAVVAWNCAVLPEGERGRIMDSFLAGITDPLDQESIESTEEIKELIEELIEDKLALFPKDRRLIKHYKLTKHKLGFHLSVAYSMAR
ncbi:MULTISPECIES: hypothetical protein [unclassified Synechocystis]|uniref:hypothetical protein n=1 Tax=unclassified Synechocystis TaxID=2640012 RepID=UPI00048D5088|nr:MULTISPECIES: hypothetical protein [unclassified Synechocystis]MCT0255114.1 hypothetical protein [Synechocystis sp. CS-94]